MRHFKIKQFSAALLILSAVFRCHAAMLAGFGSGKFGNVDAAADHYEYVGQNIIASGHVVVRMLDMQMTADKAVFNPESEDMELAGNVTFTTVSKSVESVSVENYNKMILDPYSSVKKLDEITDPYGNQKIMIEVTRNPAVIKAERISGNMKTGLLQFRNFTMQSGSFFCTGERAERFYNGKIVVKDAKFSACNYIMDDHDHYAVRTKSATVTPRNTSRGVFNYSPDHGEHSVWAWNNFIEVFGIPVLWLPVLHKPKDISTFGIRLEFSKDDDLGYAVRTVKNFQLLDDPYLNANLMLDYFSDRGFGYGVGLDLMTPETSTEIFFYGLNDKDPYNYWGGGSKSSWAENNSRLKIPHYRYEFRVSNMSHLLPRLDFRFQVDKLSDYNVLDEYFTARYNALLEPPSFGSLEYQGDRFTATAYTAFRVNDFFSTVERLPELRLDFQRQELFQNVYYQGENSFDYLQMRWREFDRPRRNPALGDLKDYETFRFDSLHMFYYPLKFFNVNVIPRAGIRLTAYSDSSDKKISYEDLDVMSIVDAVDGQPALPAVNYDSKGGSRIRIAGEIGVEVNTKFYKSWQNVKSAYWELDGLRHVMQPYINYTYIPKPNVSNEHLYYFDEIDRISEQNVIRLGLLNRLQTRRNGQIAEIFSLEQFWDYYFHKESGFSSIGDIGTILSITPGHGLSLTSQLLFDMGLNNDHKTEASRNGKRRGRPGLSYKYINRWYTQFAWAFAPHWKISAYYNYSDEYNQRTPYSMGTMYAAINASSMFLSRYTRSQACGVTLDFPLYFDEHLFGTVGCAYDVEDALFTNMYLSLRRRFHCVDLTLTVGQKSEWDNRKKETSPYFAFFISLANMPGVGAGYKVGE